MMLIHIHTYIYIQLIYIYRHDITYIMCIPYVHVPHPLPPRKNNYTSGFWCLPPPKPRKIPGKILQDLKDNVYTYFTLLPPPKTFIRGGDIFYVQYLDTYNWYHPPCCGLHIYTHIYAHMMRNHYQNGLGKGCFGLHIEAHRQASALRGSNQMLLTRTHTYTHTHTLTCRWWAHTHTRTHTHM
jgi:hypothetical protein